MWWFSLLNEMLIQIQKLLHIWKSWHAWPWQIVMPSRILVPGIHTDDENNTSCFASAKTRHPSLHVPGKCNGLLRLQRVLQKKKRHFYPGADKKKGWFVRRMRGGEKRRCCAQRFSQLAFSQCTHALILLFLLVLRTAEVRITPGPVFSTTDSKHAQIKE